jgi:hypothetical protein
MSLESEGGPCLTNSKNRDNEVAPRTASLIIIVQEPAEEAEASIPTENVAVEASIPTENVGDSPNLTSVAVRRKAAKRTLPWGLKVGELHLVPSLSPPQAEDIPATKKPRLEEPFSATVDEATTKHYSHDTAVSLPVAAAAATKKPRLEELFSAIADEATIKHSSHDTVVSLPAAAAATDNTDADPVEGTRTSWTWTLEEDAKVKDAVTNNCTKRNGREYRIDWAAVVALVPNRTKVQCNNRWHHVLDPNIDRSNERGARWTEVEDIKLKDAVQTHGGKNWGAIAALVLGRTVSQCYYRWKDVLDLSIDRANGRTGKWTEDEDSKLQDAVKTHGGKNWKTIAALVPDRTKEQCTSRWYNYLNQRIDRATGRSGKWTEYEDSKLRDAVQRHGGNHWGNHWGEIAALVPGRTKKQCQNRWRSRAD